MSTLTDDLGNTCDSLSQMSEFYDRATQEGIDAKRALSKLPRLDFHISENAKRPACLLIEEESGLMVAEFPNSPQGIEDCVAVVKAVNSYDALVDALKVAQSDIRQLRQQLFGNAIEGPTQVKINAALALAEAEA